MQLIGSVLLVISIAAIAVPIGTVVFIYRDNLSGLVITPQIQDIMNGSSNILANDTNSNANDNATTDLGGLVTPVFVSCQIDQASRTFIVTVNVTNNVNYDLTISDFSATAVDSQSSYQLATISLAAPVAIPAGQSSLVDVSGSWTQAAESYVSSTYPGASSINVDLINAMVDVNGVTVQSSQPIEMGVVPIS